MAEFIVRLRSATTVLSEPDCTFQQGGAVQAIGGPRGAAGLWWNAARGAAHTITGRRSIRPPSTGMGAVSEATAARPVVNKWQMTQECGAPGSCRSDSHEWACASELRPVDVPRK